jgi:hypothetical protein
MIAANIRIAAYCKVKLKIKPEPGLTLEGLKSLLYPIILAATKVTRETGFHLLVGVGKHQAVKSIFRKCMQEHNQTLTDQDIER